MYKLIETVIDEKRKVYDETYEQHPEKPNVILHHKILTEEIDLEQLTKQITDIDNQLSFLPVPISYVGSDERVKELVDQRNFEQQEQRDAMEEEKTKLVELKSEIEKWL